MTAPPPIDRAGRAGSVPRPAFEVRYDAVARRLRWTMRGFWTMREVAGLGAAMQDALAPLGPPPHRFDGLCDSRDFPVQSAEVSNALGLIDKAGSAMRQGRVAIVVGSMINKLQAERTLTSPDVRVFLTMEDAEAWLNQDRHSE
ncbi:hypothetical protein [Sphingomonas sp.]|jgi:hypothetical protein|uniref:hypothetical protein n=1 Tax=Sphingomonas sp. TaxID=28214 RepID=UPI002D7E636E|nr:hypothetical protein [Sphingomonas sp.]HEU0044029.1 hypothetical protein [Sphingomonas sp.]